MSEPDVNHLLARMGASYLYTRGARRVWIFGALANGHAPDALSDLDFAVEGIPLIKLSGLRSEMKGRMGMKVDIVDWGTAPPALRAHILRTRVLLPRGV